MKRTILIMVFVISFASMPINAEQFSLLYKSNWVNFLSVSNPSPDTIYVSGLGGLIVFSSDAGKHWRKQVSGVKYEWLNSIYFTNRNSGWIAGSEGTVFNTENGETWLGKKLPNAHLMDIVSPNNLLCIACGMNGRIFRSNDSGKNWQMVQTESNDLLNKLFSISPKNLWVVGAAGTVMQSVDTGLTWRKRYINSDKMLFSIFFTDEMHGWICGSSGTVLKTIDGGKNWKNTDVPSKQELCGISFLDAEVGITIGGAVKGESYIFITKNGAKSWIKFKDPFKKWWKSVICSSNGNCIMVGNDSVVQTSLKKLITNEKKSN